MLSTEKYGDLLLAVFGDDHSPRFPDVWALSWVDVNGDEITGTGYERVPVSNNADVWTLDGATVTNVTPIDGGTPGAADWPAIHGLRLHDEFGAVVFEVTLTAPVEPAVGVPVVLLAGDVVVAVDA